MTDTSRLTVQIEAQTKGAGEIADLETRLAALEKAYGGATVAATAHVASSARSTIASRTEAEAATGLSGALDALAGHYRMVSSGAEVFGLEATAAAGRLAAFGEVVEGLEAACLPLLIALVGLETAFQSFEYLKEAAELAGEMQAQLETLGAAVDNQGGHWDEMASGVQRWISQEAMASGILRSQLIPALNALVTAGNSVADSQKILAVAEEVAIAKHMDVREVVNDLITAEMGRGMGLERLDVNLKTLIGTSATMSDWLKVLHGDYQNQVAAGDSLERAWNRVHVEFEGVSLAIGNKLLPALTDLGYGAIGAFQNIDAGLKSISESFDAVYHRAKAIGDLLHGDLAGAGKEYDLGSASLAKADADWAKAFSNPFEAGHRAIDAAVKAHEQHVSDLSGLNDVMGRPRGESAGIQPAILRPDKIVDPTQVDAMTAMLGAFKDSEAGLEHVVRLAVNAQDEQAAKMALLAARTQDAKIEVSALTGVVNDDHRAWEQAASTYRGAEAALAGWQKAHQGQKMTPELDQQERALKQAVDDAKASYDDATRVLTKHNEELQRVRQAAIAAGYAEQEAAAAIVRKWAEAQEAAGKAYLESRQQNAERIADEKASFDKTTAQQIAAYQEQLANLDQYDAEYLKRRADLENKIDQLREKGREQEIDAEKKALEELQRAYKKTLDEETKIVESFIDNVVSKHKSLRDELKSIYDQILKNWESTVAKQIVGLPGTQSIFAGLGFGPAGGANQPTFTGGALNVHVQNAGPDALSKLTGSSTGVSPSSLQAILNTSSPGKDFAGMSFGDDTGMGPSASVVSKLSAAKLLGGALTGAALGSSIADLLNPNGNSTGSQIGGALGGIAALVTAANPLAGLALEVGGSLLGGLFGNHEQGWQMPDITEPTYGTKWSYGQFTADWQGTGGQFGQNYVLPEAGYYTANGGTSMAQSIENAIAQPSSTFSAALQPIVAQLQQLAGANGKGLGIASESQGYYTLDSGAKISVQQFMDLISNFETLSGGANAIPTFTISRPYGNANLSTSSATGSVPANGFVIQPQITVNLNGGTVVGSGGMDELATTIAQTTYNQLRGIGPAPGRSDPYSSSAGGY